MNKKIFIALLFVFIITLSISTINASDVNVTDSLTIQSDDADLQEINLDSTNANSLESNTNDNVLESEASSTLSTDTENSNVLKSDNASSTTKIDVSKTVTSQDITKYYKGSAKYTATFLNTDGSSLANSDVKITVNGVEYTPKTDANGVASLDINLKPGKYTVVATNPITGFSLTNTFTILATITAKNVNKVYKDSKKFYATFLKSNGKALAKKYIKFKIKGKTYKVKTNSKGVASLSLKSLKKGTYKIISYNNDGSTITNTVKVVKSCKTSLTAYTYTFLKKDTKRIKVKLLNKFGYAPPKGKIIKFKINGKTYKAKTNSNGIATIKLPSLKVGVYTVKYTFSKSGYYKASSTKSKVYIIPSKNPSFTVKSTTAFGHGAGTPFKVALTSGNVPLVSKTVTLTVNGETFTKTTNSNGIVSLPINLDIGKYTISYTNKADSKIKSKTGYTDITVFERTKTNIKWTSSTALKQGTQPCQVLVLDANNNAVSGGTVKLNVNSKIYTAKTASNGYATINADFAAGNYSVSYEYGGDNQNAPSSGTTSVSVEKATTISIKNIVAGATNLKNYYESNKNLPSTVTAGGISFTVPEFLYLMDQAIYQISNSNYNDIPFINGVLEPSSPSGDQISSKDLTKANYVSVAANVVTYITSNKQAPNFASSSVGKIIYSEIVDASARILAFYGSNNRLPSYVTVSYVTSGSSQSGTGLNELNTISDLSEYLKASTNCQVGNSAIKKIVDSLTSGLTSDSAKAKAIFEWVRNTLSYSFYYNTKYGAVGALNAKKGNCVDHSHLLVAMFRTAGLHARYVHGTCKFTSGSTYGHVWTQVLINGKWTVADATSSRNSLGSIANWNTKSFTLKGIYSSISF